MTPPLDDTVAALPAPTAAASSEGPDALVDRAAEAALRLAADRPWSEITLRDIAEAAGAPFAALYARAPGKSALLHRYSRRLDAEAMDLAAGDRSAAAHDRLFEAFMARLEAMQPHRDALIAIGRSEGALVAQALPRTARALSEAAGVDTSGWRGGARLAALTGVWARTLQVWRDDDGALNRTMAEIDSRLKAANRRLARLRADWT